jgi:hypothetical protein
MIIASLWFIKHRNAAKILIGITLIDLLFYSQVTLPATVYSPYKRVDYEAYFKALPSSPDQGSASIPYKLLIENYEPKMMGIWRNTATYHKSLTFDGHNQTQFIGFNWVEQNGGLEFAKENALFYEVSERIDLKKDTLKKSACLWQSDELVKINKDTLQIKKPHIGMNEFSVQVANRSAHSDLLVLNQNYHEGWSARINSKELNIHRVNEAFMAVEIPSESKGKVVFAFDAPFWRKSLWIGGFTWILMMAGILYFLIKRPETLPAER